MSLRDWLSGGWLLEHESTAREISDLLGIADRDLADCEAKGLSADWRLNIAYNAALQLATAALAAEGFRAARESHHYRVIQSLQHTIEAESHLVSTLDRFRRKRNVGGYERAGTVSDLEADEMIKLARGLRKRVTSWLRDHHPELLQT